MNLKGKGWSRCDNEKQKMHNVKTKSKQLISQHLT